MTIGIIIFGLAGLLVAEVGRRAGRRELPRNHVAGIRLPSTMADDESWEIAHRAGGPILRVVGWLGVLMAVLAALAERTRGEESARPILIGASILLLLGVLYSGYRATAALRDRAT